MIQKLYMIICLAIICGISAQTISSSLPSYKDGDASRYVQNGASKVFTIDGAQEDRIGWLLFDTRNRDLKSIEKAWLSLYVRSVTTPGTLKVFALKETIPYSEFDVRFADIKFDKKLPLSSLAITASSVEQIIQIDVTSIIKSDSFFGFVLLCDDGGLFTIDTKEGNSEPSIFLSYSINDQLNKWLSGTGSPASGVGKEGDFYLDIETSDIFKKSTDNWSLISNIKGDRGPQGYQGPKGDSGPQGPQGIQGPIGLPGIPGEKGEKGDSGPAGTNGTSVLWRGVWDSTLPYNINEIVTYNGSAYIAVNQSVNKNPKDSVSSWQIMVEKGAQGPQGLQGERGETGIQGPTGPQGVAGPIGPSGPTGTSGSPAPSFPWVVVHDSTVTLQANTGYIADTSKTVNFTLPTAVNPGDIVKITGAGAGGWKLLQNAGQSVQVNKVEQKTFGSWTPVISDNQWWTSVTGSSDCSKLWVASYSNPDLANSGYILYSKDAGSTWQSQGHADYWSALKASKDGSSIYGVTCPGRIFISHDTGTTWEAADSARNWMSVACSFDGSHVAAVSAPGKIAVSSNYGTTWEYMESERTWTDVSMSSDGMSIAASTDSGFMYISRDAGSTWTPHGGKHLWQSVRVSADGMTITAFSLNGGSILHYSRDGGINWTERKMGSSDSTSIFSHMMSNDGNTVIGLDYTRAIYYSFDGGVNWNSYKNSGTWWRGHLSDDGSKMVVIQWDKPIVAGTSEIIPITSTTPGTSGYLTGGQGSTAEIQYLGNNRFLLNSYSGSVTAQ